MKKYEEEEVDKIYKKKSAELREFLGEEEEEEENDE